MDYNEWLHALCDIIELETGIPREQHQAVFNIQDDAWRQMHQDGLDPREAFEAEKYAYSILV